MSMPHFVTSAQGRAHVTSANSAHLTAGTIGNGSYLLPLRSKMAATMIDSNTLRILAGDAVCCGRQWEIAGDYEEVNIDNGVPGYSRIDLVVAHIETAPQETLELRVIKGEETTGTPVVPGHIDGDLNDGDTVTEMPICSVRIDGINPQEPVSLLRELTTLASLKAECDEHWDSLSQCPFPVGHLYLSFDKTDPAKLWPGTKWQQGGTGYYMYGSFTSVGNSWDATTNAAGLGQPHNNMPAYQDVYAWRRTA
ncbi:MAG: hypothetical protein HFJ67_10295 [Adlercreutzia mucosicola]|nr:hypothetical protein [Adlercreutzia mucosicola]